MQAFACSGGADTGAERVVPPERRAEVSRTAGRISPVGLASGRVAGVWRLGNDSGQVEVTLFEKVARRALTAETARLAGILGRDLSLVVQPA